MRTGPGNRFRLLPGILFRWYNDGGDHSCPPLPPCAEGDGDVVPVQVVSCWGISYLGKAHSGGDKPKALPRGGLVSVCCYWSGLKKKS